MNTKQTIATPVAVKVNKVKVEKVKVKEVKVKEVKGEQGVGRRLPAIIVGPLDTALMITNDHEGNDSVTLPHTPHHEFQQLCDKVWQGLCLSSDDVNDQFARWKCLHNDQVFSFLNRDE